MPDPVFSKMSKNELYHYTTHFANTHVYYKKALAALSEIEKSEKARQDEIDGKIEMMQSDIQKLTKPHWTLVPIFGIALVALFVALLQYCRPAKTDVQNAQNINLRSEVSKTFTSLPPTSKTNKAGTQNNHGSSKRPL
jgi:hypothetical protein